jgi:hypothetical protein
MVIDIDREAGCNPLSRESICPEEYYHYDFKSVEVGVYEVEDYSFSWVTPDVAGT